MKAFPTTVSFCLLLIFDVSHSRSYWRRLLKHGTGRISDIFHESFVVEKVIRNVVTAFVGDSELSASSFCLNELLLTYNVFVSFRAYYFIKVIFLMYQIF